MSTPSEKPMCKHGNIMQHEILPEHFTPSAYWCSGPVIATPKEKCPDCGHRGHVEGTGGCYASCGCQGPGYLEVSVIATPEKCKHKTWRSDVGKWVRRCADCGLIRVVTVEELRGVSTEPETPSYIPNLSTDGQQKPCDARCGHNNHRIGCLNDPASEATVTDEEAEYRARIPFEVIFTRRASSDPTPELRGRLENAVRDNLLSTTPYFELAITKIVNAVLDEIGERK